MRSFALVMTCATCGVLSGCITLYSKTEVVRSDEPRIAVRFETAEAARLFNEQLKREDETIAQTYLGVPFINVYLKAQKLSEAAVFNELVHRCDLDQDCLITELEIRALTSERDT